MDYGFYKKKKSQPFEVTRSNDRCAPAMYMNSKAAWRTFNNKQLHIRKLFLCLMKSGKKFQTLKPTYSNYYLFEKKLVKLPYQEIVTCAADPFKNWIFFYQCTYCLCYFVHWAKVLSNRFFGVCLILF